MSVDPYRLASPAAVSKLLGENGIVPDRRKGQNFLTDPNVMRKVVGAAGLTDRDVVIEIGAGLGSLTQALVETAGRVYAIEWDRRLFDVVSRELAYARNLALVLGDAARLDLASLFDGEPPDGVKMVSNLPYGIAATVLVESVTTRPWIRSYTVTVQREVADRLLASPGGRDYSAATVKVRYRAAVDRVARVSRNSFLPPPKVDSTIISLTRLPPARPPFPSPLEGERRGGGDPDHFDRLVTLAFAQRRKKLANALAAAGEEGLEAGAVREALASLGLDPETRPEQVSPEQYGRLSDLLAPGVVRIGGHETEESGTDR